MSMQRKAEVVRDTSETQIRVAINIDGTGQQKLDTGVPFLDHMLDQIARHGLIDLDIAAKAQPLIEFLDEPDLNLIRHTGLDTSKLTADARLNVKLALPLIKNAPKDRISVNVTAKLSNAALKDALPGIDISEGDIGLTVEKGVFKALEDELLTSMVLAIYTEHPITKEDLLLETYEFRFSFPSNQYATINGVQITSKEDIRSQAAKFSRNLISFTQTLDDLPKNNWITMQMKVRAQLFL